MKLSFQKLKRLKLTYSTCYGVRDCMTHTVSETVQNTRVVFRVYHSSCFRPIASFGFQPTTYLNAGEVSASYVSDTPA